MRIINHARYLPLEHVKSGRMRDFLEQTWFFLWKFKLKNVIKIKICITADVSKLNKFNIGGLLKNSISFYYLKCGWLKNWNIWKDQKLWFKTFL